jgi:hypothetical protein
MRYALLFLAVTTLGAQSLQFDFVSDKPAQGFQKVLPSTMYSEETGYGFEEAAQQPPFYFSVRVPEEGNYRVTVTLGDPAADSVTTVKAEIRRLMLERVRVAAGKIETRSFLVNVRTPKIAGGGEVRLKDREKTSEARAWDNRPPLSSPIRTPPCAPSSWRRPTASPPSTSPATRLPQTSPANRSTVGDRCCRASSSPRSRSPTTANPASPCAGSSAKSAGTRY